MKVLSSTAEALLREVWTRGILRGQPTPGGPDDVVVISPKAKH